MLSDALLKYYENFIYLNAIIQCILWIWRKIYYLFNSVDKKFQKRNTGLNRERSASFIKNLFYLVQIGFLFIWNDKTVKCL